MRIETAIYASKGSLDAHAQAIAVVGDNISNMNTVGFKRSRVEFSDLVTDFNKGTSSGNIPVVGGGVQVTGIKQVQEAGVAEFTARPLDVAIAGKGFFVVGSADSQKYTRAGNFFINEEGLLTTSKGDTVLGYQGTSTSLSTVDMNEVDTSGSETTTATLKGNLNSQSNAIDVLPNNILTFNEIGGVANLVTSFKVYDSLGESHDITLAFFKTDANSWTAQAYIDGGEVGGTEGTPVQLGNNATLTFGTDGKIAEANKGNAVITANPAYINGAAQGNFTIDLGSFTQYANTSILNNVVQDGDGAGSIVDYSIDKDGSIYAQLSSGGKSLVGKIPLAVFANAEGLDREGNGLYVESNLSGSAKIDLPQVEDRGSLEPASLERSTVDMATEFTDLVIMQRGYQASSQTLNAAATIIRDTLSLIR